MRRPHLQEEMSPFTGARNRNVPVYGAAPEGGFPRSVDNFQFTMPGDEELQRV